MIKNLNEVTKSQEVDLYEDENSATPTIIQLGYGELKNIKVAQYLNLLFEQILDKCSELQIALPDSIFENEEVIALMIAKLEETVNVQLNTWKINGERLSGNMTGSVYEVLSNINKNIEINSADLKYILFDNYHRIDHVNSVNYNKYTYNDAPTLTPDKIKEDNKAEFSFEKKIDEENIEVINFNPEEKEEINNEISEKSENTTTDLDELTQNLLSSNETNDVNNNMSDLGLDVSDLYGIEEEGEQTNNEFNESNEDLAVTYQEPITNQPVEEQVAPVITNTEVHEIKQAEVKNTQNSKNTQTIQVTQTTQTMQTTESSSSSSSLQHSSSSPTPAYTPLNTVNDRWSSLLKKMRVDPSKNK